MSKAPQPTHQEQKFESAKRAANKERDSQTAAHDEKTARLKAQRLGKEADDKLGPKKG